VGEVEHEQGTDRETYEDVPDSKTQEWLAHDLANCEAAKVQGGSDTLHSHGRFMHEHPAAIVGHVHNPRMAGVAPGDLEQVAKKLAVALKQEFGNMLGAEDAGWQIAAMGILTKMGARITSGGVGVVNLTIST
jgi:hypothetical protein